MHVIMHNYNVIMLLNVAGRVARQVVMDRRFSRTFFCAECNAFIHYHSISTIYFADIYRDKII